MSPQLIAILIFLVGMVIVAIAYRKSTLSHLEMLPGEVVLLEEEKVKVTQGGAPRSTIFLGCKVIVTDRRVIISQKIPFGKRYIMRHLISYGFYKDETDLGSTIKKGYIIMNVQKSDIHIREDKEKTVIRIDIPKSLLTRGQYIEFKTNQPEGYKRQFL